MKELGHFIKEVNGKKFIKMRGNIHNKLDIVDMPCPFSYTFSACTEDCDQLKFEQFGEGYAKNEFDVTFGCTDSIHCSLYVED